MPRYVVYYADDPSAHYTREGDTVDNVHVDAICALDADDLESVFRQMNVVDGDEKPVAMKVRSMCCGDFVHDMTNDTWHYCDTTGWRQFEVT